jgi:large subunit ribosomal protein L5
MKLQELYKKQIVPALKDKLHLENVMSVPKLSKVVINVGFGRNSKDKELVKIIEENLATLSGQKPILNKAKKAISAFKIREGMIIGAKVTLRGSRMWDFVEKLVNIYFPRVRDFRGLSEKTVDDSGNLTVGFKDILAFPEIEVADLEKLHGLEICLNTTAGNRDAGLEMFRALNFPLINKEEK